MNRFARGLPIALDVEGARVVVVGDGDEARRKAGLLRACGAEVEVVWPFAEAALAGARIVMLAMRDPALAAEVRRAAQAQTHGALVWCSDDPAHSDFAMPAIVQLGSAMLAITTAGKSPALAAKMRGALEVTLGAELGQFVDALGEKREAILRDEPDPERRRALLTELLDGFDLQLAVRYPTWWKR